MALHLHNLKSSTPFVGLSCPYLGARRFAGPQKAARIEISKELAAIDPLRELRSHPRASLGPPKHLNSTQVDWTCPLRARFQSRGTFWPSFAHSFAIVGARDEILLAPKLRFARFC